MGRGHEKNMNVSIPERRREGRKRILMDVRCRIGPGMSPMVWLSDITTIGCQIIIREGELKGNQNVVIKLEGIDGIPGKVKWVFRSTAGIEFERPLHAAVLNYLLSGQPEHAALMGEGFVDRFGRPMPKWPRERSREGNRLWPCS